MVSSPGERGIPVHSHGGALAVGPSSAQSSSRDLCQRPDKEATMIFRNSGHGCISAGRGHATNARQDSTAPGHRGARLRETRRIAKEAGSPLFLQVGGATCGSLCEDAGGAIPATAACSLCNQLVEDCTISARHQAASIFLLLGAHLSKGAYQDMSPDTAVTGRFQTRGTAPHALGVSAASPTSTPSATKGARSPFAAFALHRHGVDNRIKELRRREKELEPK